METNEQLAAKLAPLEHLLSRNSGKIQVQNRAARTPAAAISPMKDQG